MTIDDGARHTADPWTSSLPGSSASAGNDVPTEATTEVETRPRTPRRTWPLSHVAFGIAVLLVILEGVAVYLANFGEPLAATVLGQVLVVCTALPFALGLLAVIRNRKRGWGIAAMVLSLIANPVLLLNLLRLFGGI